MNLSKKIGNLALLARCLAYTLLHGKADRLPKNISRVILIPNSKLGDMIVATPMFRAIKRTYPDCKVTVVGSTTNKKVLEENPDIDSYIVWNDDIDTMIGIIKAGRYDFGCVAAPGLASLATLYLAGIPCIVAPYITHGWSPYETKSYKLIRNFVLQKEHQMQHSVSQQYLRLLEPIGIYTDDKKTYIFWSKEADEKINAYIINVKENAPLVVGIMPGAGNKIKEWPPSRFAEVADYVIEKYNAQVIIVGSKLNRKEIDDMLTNVRHTDRVHDCSWTSIDEMKALVSKLDMTISVDTGPVFIAQASGVPTIDIAGAIHPDEMAPNDGNMHLLVRSEGKPQLWTMNARVYDYKEVRRQIESITVSMVIHKIDELLAKRKKNTGRI